MYLHWRGRNYDSKSAHNGESTSKEMLWCCHKHTTQTAWSIPHCVPTYSLVIPSHPISLLFKEEKRKKKTTKGQAKNMCTDCNGKRVTEE